MMGDEGTRLIDTIEIEDEGCEDVIVIKSRFSKGATMVRFKNSTGYPNLNYKIHKDDDTSVLKSGNISSGSVITLSYGTNYKPGDSRNSICMGTQILYYCIIPSPDDPDAKPTLDIAIRRNMTDFDRVTGISLNSTDISLSAGRSSQLKASVSNNKGKSTSYYDDTVLFSSSNSEVATVNNKGKITGRKMGRATITAVTLDGGYTATCKVNVDGEFLFPFFEDGEEYIEPESATTEKEEFKSVIPANSVSSSTGSAAGSVVPMVGGNLSEQDDINQEFLAKAFAASMGKTATIVTECTIYPTRLLSKEEDGSIQTLTFGNIPGKEGEDVYGLAYNQTDGAYVMSTKLDENETARFEDFKLRSATNLSIFLCK